MNWRIYSLALKALPLVLMVSIINSCGEEKELVSSETRELTTLDMRPILINATSRDRFERKAADSDGKGKEIASGYLYVTPEGWIEKVPTMFRTVNLFLPSGGEAYVSEVGGNILDNVNRWYKQFGQEAINQSQLESLETIKLLGEKAYFVEATGSYNPGMGKEALKGVTLYGAIKEKKGSLVTVKFIAPEKSAQDELANFKTFCESLEKR